jgi:hypothetical protein
MFIVFVGALMNGIKEQMQNGIKQRRGQYDKTS